MKRQFLAMAAALILTAISAADSMSQTSRASVPASEVNGTFRRSFTGRFKGSSNEIKIWALGKRKLQVAFDLIHPFVDGTGELSANLGTGGGTATIDGDTAVYRSDEFGGECVITIKFVKPGTIRVSQEGASTCGFGHNVTAAGTYVRSSRAKPKFDQEN